MGHAEETVAGYLERACIVRGILCEKIKCEGANGCPDYLLTFPNGRMKRVETKSKDGAVSPQQGAYHRKLARYRSFVFVPASRDDVDTFISTTHEWWDLAKP